MLIVKRFQSRWWWVLAMKTYSTRRNCIWDGTKRSTIVSLKYTIQLISTRRTILLITWKTNSAISLMKYGRCTLKGETFNKCNLSKIMMNEIMNFIKLLHQAKNITADCQDSFEFEFFCFFVAFLWQSEWPGQWFGGCSNVENREEENLLHLFYKYDSICIHGLSLSFFVILADYLLLALIFWRLVIEGISFGLPTHCIVQDCSP